MQALKNKVSGTRRRMIEGDYNIDLSYICQDRIIVMSFPASGKETMYRNDYKQVSHQLFQTNFLICRFKNF